MSTYFNPEIRLALEKINFADRYVALSKDAWSNSEDFPLDKLSPGDISQIINQLGYSATYNKKEQFHKVGLIEHESGYIIYLNIAVHQTRVEFILVAYFKGELVLGDPWGLCLKLLKPYENKVPPPRYSDKENLTCILSDGLKLYDDFVDAITATANTVTPAPNNLPYTQ